MLYGPLPQQIELYQAPVQAITAVRARHLPRLLLQTLPAANAARSDARSKRSASVIVQVPCSKLPADFARGGLQALSEPESTRAARAGDKKVHQEDLQ